MVMREETIEPVPAEVLPREQAKVDTIEQMPIVEESEKEVNHTVSEIVPEIVVQKTQVLEISRQSRSPNRAQSSVNVGHLDATSSVPRVRSRSPIWCPGNTTYADVLRGLEAGEMPTNTVTNTVGMYPFAEAVEVPRSRSPRPPKRKHQMEQKSFQPSSEMQQTKWSPSFDETVTRRDDKPSRTPGLALPVAEHREIRKTDSDSSSELTKEDITMKKPNEKSHLKDQGEKKVPPPIKETDEVKPEIPLRKKDKKESNKTPKETTESFEKRPELAIAQKPQKPSRKKSKKQKKTEEKSPELPVVEAIETSSTPGVRIVTIMRKKIIRHFTIVNGKEQVREEIVGEPVEVEVMGDVIPTLDTEIVIVEETPTYVDANTKIDDSGVALQSPIETVVEHITRTITIIRKKIIRHITVIDGKEHVTEEVIEEPVEIEVTGQEIPILETEIVVIGEELKISEPVSAEISMDTHEPISQFSGEVHKSLKSGELNDKNENVDKVVEVTAHVEDYKVESSVIAVSQTQELPIPVKEEIKPVTEEPKKSEREKGKSKKKKDKKSIQKSDEEVEPEEQTSQESLPEKISKFVTIIKKKIIRHVRIIDGVEQVTEEIVEEPAQVEIVGDEVPDIEPEIVTSYVEEKIEFKPISELEIAKKSLEAATESVNKETSEEDGESKKKPKRKKDRKQKAAETPVVEDEIKQVPEVQLDIPEKSMESPTVNIFEEPKKSVYAGLPLDDTANAWMDAEIVLSDDDEPLADGKNAVIIGEPEKTEIPINVPQTGGVPQSNETLEKGEGVEEPSSLDQNQEISLDRWDGDQLDSIPEGEETEEFSTIQPQETTVTQSIIDLDNKKVFAKRKHLKKSVKFVDGQEQVTEEIEEEPIEYDLTGNEIPVFRDDSVTLVHKNHLEEFSKAFPEIKNDDDSSIIQTIVKQTTRKVVRHVTKVLRNVTIIDGKEHVTEEVIEVPEEVEVTEDVPEYCTEIIESGTEKPLWKFIIIQSPEKNVERTILVNKVNVIRNIVIEDGKKSVIEEHIDEPIEIKVTQEEKPIHDKDIITLIEQNAPEIIKARIPYGENEEVEDVIAELIETTPAILFEVPEIPTKFANGSIDSDIVEEVKSESTKILDDVNNEEKIEGTSTNLEFIVTKSYKVNPEAFLRNEDQVELEPIILDATISTEKRKKSVQFDDTVTVIAETPSSGEAEDVYLGKRDSTPPEINVGQMKEDLDVGQNESVPEIDSYIEQRETQRIFIDPVPFMIVEFPEICAEFTLTADEAKEEISENTEVIEEINQEVVQPVKDQTSAFLQNLHADLANTATYNEFLDAERDFYRFSKSEKTTQKDIKEIVVVKDDAAPEKFTVTHFEVPHFDVLSISEAERNYYLYLNSAETIPKQIDEVSFASQEVQDDDDIILVEDKPEIISIDDKDTANVTNDSSFTENDRSMEEIQVKHVPQVEQSISETSEETPKVVESEKPVYAGLPLDDSADAWMDAEIVISDDDDTPQTPQKVKDTHEKVVKIVTIMKEKIIRRIKIVNGIEQTTEEIVREPMDIEVIDDDIPDFKPEIVIIREKEDSELKPELNVAQEIEPPIEAVKRISDENETETATQKITKIITIIRKKIIRHVKIVDGKEQVTEEVIEEPVEVEVVGDEIPILEPEIVISHDEEKTETITVERDIEIERPDIVVEEIISQKEPNKEKPPLEVKESEVIEVIEPVKEPEIATEIIDDKIEIAEEKASERVPELVEKREIIHEKLEKNDISEEEEIGKKDEIHLDISVEPTSRTTEQIKRVITIIRKRIIRHVTIVNGKENVTEEVIEEPVEVEVVGDEIPILKPEVEVREVQVASTESQEIDSDQRDKVQQLPDDEKTIVGESYEQKPKSETIVKETRVITIIRKRIIRHVVIVDGKEEVREEVIEEPVEVEVFGDEIPSLDDLMPDTEFETVENVTEEVIRSGKKIIQHIEIIDGKEHITEEVIDLPEEIEIIRGPSQISLDASLEIIPKDVHEEVREKVAESKIETVEKVDQRVVEKEISVREVPLKPTYAGLPLDETSDAWMDVDEMVFSDDEEETPVQDISAKENDRSMEEVEIPVTTPIDEKLKDTPKESQQDLLLNREESVVEIEIADSNQLEKFLQQERMSHMPKEMNTESKLSVDAQEFIPQFKGKLPEDKVEEHLELQSSETQDLETQEQIPYEFIERPINVIDEQKEEKVEKVVEEKSISSEPKKFTEQQLREKELFEQKKKLKREMRGKKKGSDEVKAESSSPEQIRESPTEVLEEQTSVWALPGDKKTYAEVVADNLSQTKERVHQKSKGVSQLSEVKNQEDIRFIPETTPESPQIRHIVEEVRQKEIKETDLKENQNEHLIENFSWYDAIVEQEKLLSSDEPTETKSIESIPPEPSIQVDIVEEKDTLQPQSTKSWASVVGSFVTNLFDSTPKHPESQQAQVHGEKGRESSSDNSKSTSDSDNKAQKLPERKTVKTKKMPATKPPEQVERKPSKKSKKGKFSEEESPSSEKDEDNEWIILATPSVDESLKSEVRTEEEISPVDTESKKDKLKKKKKSKKSSTTPDVEYREPALEQERIDELTQKAFPLESEIVKEAALDDTPEEKSFKKNKKKAKKGKKEPEKQTSSDSFEQDWVDVTNPDDKKLPQEGKISETSAQTTKVVTIIRKKIIRYVVKDRGVEQIREEIVEEPIEVEVFGNELPVLETEIITIDQSPSAPESEEPVFVDDQVRDIPAISDSVPDEVSEQITKTLTIFRKKIIRYITIIDGKEQVNEEVVEEPVEIEVFGDEIPVLEPEVVIVKELELEPVSREKLSSTEPEEPVKSNKELPRKLEVATEIVIAEYQGTPVESEPIVETREFKREEVIVEEQKIPMAQTKPTEHPETPVEDREKTKKKKNKKDKKKISTEEGEQDMLKVDEKSSHDTSSQSEEIPTVSITDKITKIITIIRKKIIRHVKIVDGKEQVTEEVIEEPVEVEVVGDEIPILEPEIVISHDEEKTETIPVERDIEIEIPEKVVEEIISQKEPNKEKPPLEVKELEVIEVIEPVKEPEIATEIIDDKIEIAEEKASERVPELVEKREIIHEKLEKNDISEEEEIGKKDEIHLDISVEPTSRTTEQIKRVITIIRKRIIRHVTIVNGKENVTEEVIEEPVEVEVVGDEIPILKPEVEVREVQVASTESQEIDSDQKDEVHQLPNDEKTIVGESHEQKPKSETIVKETRVITIIRKRIIRHVVIVDGKEEVREEVIEEPVEVEVFGDEIPSLDDLMPDTEFETVENVTEEVIRSGKKIIQHIEIIDGKEHITEEVIDLPEEIEIIGGPSQISLDASLEIIPKDVHEEVREKVAEFKIETVEKVDQRVVEKEISVREVPLKPTYAGLPLDETSDAWMDVDEMVFSDDEEETPVQDISAKENDRSMEEVEIPVTTPIDVKLKDNSETVEEKTYAGLPLDDTTDDWMVVEDTTFADEEEPKSKTLTKLSEAIDIVTSMIEEKVLPEELPPEQGVLDDEIWKLNVQLDSSFWPNKYIYNDAEKVYFIEQKSPPKQEDSDMQLKRNLAQDLPHFGDILLLSDAERLWQTLLSHEHPKREVSDLVYDVLRENKDDDDDDNDRSRQSDSHEPLVVNVNAQVSSSRDTKSCSDFPSGGKWRGESTYLSIESIGDYPETAHESEEHPIHLDSTNITQSPPPSPVLSPILENPPDLFPPSNLPNIGISDRIIAHSTEPLVVTEPSDNSVQLNKKDAVTREIDQLLASIASTERDLVNLPNEDLAKMLEKLRDILGALKTHDSEATVIKENVSVEEPDQDVDTALITIDTKIEKLVTRATKAFSLVEDAINQQQMRQLELKKYSQLQQEIENWLSSIQIPSTKAEQEINTIEGVLEIVAEQQKLIDDIVSKEQRLQEIRDKCQDMQKQHHVQKLAKTLTEQFTIILTLLETRKQSTLNFITKLKVREDELTKEKKEDDRDTLESMSMQEEEPDVQKIEIETQTSVREEKIQDDETQTSFPLLDATPRDTQTAFVQTLVERRPTDNIIVLHTSDEEKETFEIDNQLNQPIPKDERPSDVLVEAKFNQSQPGSSARTSELVLKNVPQSFETTFVEPDETTTEVVVDSDGTKRITVRKIKRSQLQREIITQSVTVGAESIPQVQEITTVEKIPLSPEQEIAIQEGELASEPFIAQPGSETSTVRTIVQHVTRKIVRKTRKIIKKVTIIDGKEHITEEVVEEPEEVEISEEEIPNVNINLTSGVEEFVIEEPVLVKKEEVTYDIEKTESESPKAMMSRESSRETSGTEDKIKGEEDRQVLESLSAPVDLVTTTAHVDVIQPNVEIADKEDVREEKEGKFVTSTTSPFIQETLEITEIVIPQEQPPKEFHDDVEVPAQKELILTDIQEIWPPTATIDEIPVHLLDTISIGDDTQKAIDHTTDTIWPTNPDIGADVDLLRYGVSVTEVEHVIETVEKHPEEKSQEISEKSQIEELSATAYIIEASPTVTAEHPKEILEEQDIPSEQEIPHETGEIPRTEEIVITIKDTEPPPPSEPSTPGKGTGEPKERHRVEEEAERTRIKVSLPSLTSESESILTVNMKMEPNEHTKVNVNLTEEVSLVACQELPLVVEEKPESPKIPTPEIPVEKLIPEKVVFEVHEKVSGSDEQEVGQTGYEAEDVTVDDVDEESRKSKRKKKRKQKIKTKDDESTDAPKSRDEQLSEEAKPTEPSSNVQEGVENVITPDESYASISEYEVDSVKVMEEEVIRSPSPEPKPMPSELVTTVPVLDTMYVEESEQQTSLPYEEMPREEVQRESPPKEAVIQEEHSVQTSPTPQPVPGMEISQQTSPEPEPEQHEIESQTTIIESTEVEIQTTPVRMADDEEQPIEVPKPEVISEEIQTEPVAFEEKMEHPPVIETTDSTSQTIILDTREQYLQTSPTESPEHHHKEMVSKEDDVNRIAATIVDEIVFGIPTPTATQETNTEIVTIQEVTVQTTPEVPAIVSEIPPEVPEIEDSSLSTTTSEPYEIHVKASLIYPEGDKGQKIPDNFSVEVTRTFDLEDEDAPRSFHEIVEIPTSQEPVKPKTVTISLTKKTVVDELFDEPDPEEEQRKVERLLKGRLKMIQEGRESPLSNVLHLATLEESLTEESPEERLETLQDNLEELENAIHRQDSQVIQRTVTIIFEKISIWLETIEYRVYVTRQSASSSPTEKKIGEFNELRSELECIQNYVEQLRTDLEQPMQNVESKNMVQCVNVIVDHLQAIDNVTQTSELQVQEDFRRFSEYQMNVDELQLNIQQLKSNLDKIVSEEMGLDKKLHLLDEFDDINRAFGKEVQRLIYVARGLERDFPEKETPEQIFMCREMVANLDGSINIERNRLNQLANLAQEYEQTLKEFAKIIIIADSLVESQITTNNLDNLQNEIQKHRKFFVNLSHCRAILESLEMNLDPVTREKHSQLHQTLHESASTILDKASDRAQRLSMAASRWTVLERGMREEKQWLQIAQQRIPDLSDVTSTDYDQYISMYQSLSSDIAHHHAKLVQLTTTAVKLQELVSASNVEDDCNEQLFMILKLKEDVALHLKKLLKFRQFWILYETTTDKIEHWITTSEHHLEKIEIPKFFKDYPLEHMRLFWDIKAEFELYNSIKNDATGNLERALEVIPIADELLQKEFHERLESKWLNVEEKIQKIQKLIVDSMSASNVPTDEKLSLLQKELEELEKSMASVKGVIKSQDELQLYIERMQILNSRVVIVGTELGRIGLTSSSDSERIGRLFGVSHRISMQISEELDGALVLQDQLNKISHGIIRMRLLQQSAVETLDQCEAIDLSGSEIVENALYDCQRVHSDLKSHWQGIMELRQLLHTLPMRLKISVSPVMLERDISQLQDEHVQLESKCEKVLSSLRGALQLWKTFEKQLEQVQQSIQQTDYMVELLKVHGQVDYERLVKATERLQGLHGDLDSHEDLLEDLKCSAEPLIEICSTEVAHKIEVAVQETIQAWNETSQNLTDLCNKYQRAVRLWQQYRDATESLNNWVDEKEGDMKIMDSNGDLQYIKECLNALPLYKERLAEVRKMVDQISADIELEPGSLIEMDVESLGVRLETMKETITVLADEAEKKARQAVELEKEVIDSQKQLQATQKAIEDIPEEIATEEHLLNLRNHLVKLSCTQNQLQKMHSTKLEQNITTNVSIVEVLKIWQRLFKDTFQQYYRLSSTLIQNEDVDAVLKLWEDYLRHVQTFLATSIPQNYSSLSDHRHICEVHQNLLVSQKNVYEMNVKPHVAERFTELVRLHNDVLQKLNVRHSEVEERINLWDKYNREMMELLEWLKDMEQSRSRMQLNYLNLRRVPKIRQTLESLLARVTEGEDKSKELKQQHGVLLKFCDDALGTSIKMGHAAVNQRISNLKAALETWLDFVNRIIHLDNVYRQKVTYVQESLQTTQKLYTEMSQKNQVTDKNIKQQINDLREKRIDVNKLSVDLEQIGVVLEEMKECVSPYDLKSMRQIVWILWQQQGDLNQQLGTFINNLVDKLSLWKMFNDKYTVLSAWMDHLEKRIEMGTQFVYVGEPEEIQKYIENEIATEMSFKERDRDWVLSSGRQLLTLFSDSDNQSQATEIQEKLNTIIERWEKLKYLTKVRGNELKDLRLTTMRLEIRIAELRSWLFKMETEVTRPLHVADLSEASHKTSWREHDELQKAMEKECINFAEVLNLCDMLFKDVNTWKSHFNIGALSVAINNVENRWANVCNLLTARGNKILTMWNLFGELQKLDNEHKQWVLEKRRIVDGLLKEKVSRNDLAERVEFVREQIEEVRHREPERHIQEKNYHGLVASNTLDTNNINELLGDLPIVLNDWSTLLPSLMSLHDKLQNDLCLYGKFVQSHEKAVLNLSQIDAHLTQVEHQLPADGEESSASKSQQILSVEDELKDCSELLETADKVGLALMETFPDVTPIQAMVDEYQNLYRDISQRLHNLREKYVAEVDESVQVNTLTFEQDSAVQVNTLTFVTAKDAYILELKSAIKEMRSNMTNLEKALNDSEAKSLKTIKSNKIVAACESSVELIRHLSMLLKTECNSTDKEACVEEVKDLLAQHENLMILWRSKEQKLQELSDLGRLTCPLCTQKNWQQIDNDLWRLEQWLQFAEGTQRLQSSPPTNINELEDVIQDHREFLLDLNSHKSIVASLNVVGDHLATHTLDTERAQQLRERLERNNQRWERVCQSAAKWQSALQTTLMGNKEFHSIIDELCVWLESTEAKIRAAEPVDLTVSREIMLTKFMRFRDLRSELERCEPRVVSLQEAADQLLKASTESGTEESSAVIYTRLTDLRLRLQSLRRLTGVYVVKLGAVLGVDSTEISLRTLSPYQTQSTNQLDEFGVPLEGAHSSPKLNEDDSSGGDEINTSVLARGYRFLGRVLRASLPIQALMLLLLGVVTLVPHAEDYSCIFTNNFARSLEPMLRYPNGPPPI